VPGHPGLLTLELREEAEEETAILPMLEERFGFPERV
jgi:hypothetical protein